MFVMMMPVRERARRQKGRGKREKQQHKKENVKSLFSFFFHHIR